MWNRAQSTYSTVFVIIRSTNWKQCQTVTSHLAGRRHQEKLESTKSEFQSAGKLEYSPSRMLVAGTCTLLCHGSPRTIETRGYILKVHFSFAYQWHQGDIEGAISSFVFAASRAGISLFLIHETCRFAYCLVEIFIRSMASL
jgi:hypothetical protein